MADHHQQIADLEAEIDALSDTAEQCRKSMVVARIAIGAGVLLFLASLLGLIRPDPLILVGGIAAAIAGIAFYGSSRGTLDQTIGKVRMLEARRNEIINEIDVQPVQER